jgi:hypothetical protein
MPGNAPWVDASDRPGNVRRVEEPGRSRQALGEQDNHLRYPVG